MALKGVPFHSKELGKPDKPSPVVCKSNPRLEKMLDIAMYALNMDSKSGVLKLVFEWGFNEVILGKIGADNLHKLTSGDRVRYVRKRPDFGPYEGKGK